MLAAGPSSWSCHLLLGPGLKQQAISDWAGRQPPAARTWRVGFIARRHWVLTRLQRQERQAEGHVHKPPAHTKSRPVPAVHKAPRSCRWHAPALLPDNPHALPSQWHIIYICRICTHAPPAYIHMYMLPVHNATLSPSHTPAASIGSSTPNLTTAHATLPYCPTAAPQPGPQPALQPGAQPCLPPPPLQPPLQAWG